MLEVNDVVPNHQVGCSREIFAPRASETNEWEAVICIQNMNLTSEILGVYLSGLLLNLLSSQPADVQ
jgi:hypothetical protein